MIALVALMASMFVTVGSPRASATSTPAESANDLSGPARVARAAMPPSLMGVPDLGGVAGAPAASSPWSTQRIPDPGSLSSQLSGESCISDTECVAVGSFVSNSLYSTLAETWNGTKWATQTTPNVSETRNFLNAVSCTAANACVAVGSYSTSTSSYAMAEVWNGTKWEVHTPLNPSGATGSYLTGVSCTAVTACVAVGGYGTSSTPYLTLAETWNGSSWAIQSTADPGTANYFDSVSCTTATACVAVGFGASPGTSASALAEVWNGSLWSIMSTPPIYDGLPGFVGVWCTAANACTAIGSIDYFENGVDNYLTLAEAWNGTTWTIQPTPSPSDDSHLNSVSCTSAFSCVAVGYYYNPNEPSTPLSEVWNGASWAVQSTPGSAGSSLDGVSCPAAAACVAVGANYDKAISNDLTLAESWNGSIWTIQLTADPGAFSVLQGVSCATASACVAVGYNSTYADTTLAERWNGTKWTIQPTASPAGAASSGLSSVSCTAGSACMAVGSYTSGTTTLTLAEVWNGSAWVRVPSPDPSGATSSALESVSCIAATSCMAVGYYENGSTPLPLSEEWNGTAWSIQATPERAGSIFAALNGVSCTAVKACVAVGDDDTSSGTVVTLAEVWNGAVWAMQDTPSPSGSPSSSLAAVSCTAAKACTAVGFYYHGSITQLTLAEAWNGTSWTIQSTPNPTGATNSHLNAVTCTAANACLSVGYHFKTPRELTLAEVWNGITWTIQSTPNPKAAVGNSLQGLSCTAAAACAAVGYYEITSGVDLTLAEAEGGE